MINPKKVIVIAAHFDDVEINCGGTLAVLARMGCEIKIIIVSRGQYYDVTGNLVRTSLKAESECKKALKKIELPKINLVCLGFDDTKIIFDANLIQLIERELITYQPDLILTHWLYDTHQDHLNTAQAVVAAARYYYNIFFWEPIYPSGRNNVNCFKPQIYFDISDFRNKKIRALACYKTQVNKFKDYGFDWLNGVSARAAFRGFESGCRAAEAFYVYRLKL